MESEIIKMYFRDAKNYSPQMARSIDWESKTQRQISFLQSLTKLIKYEPRILRSFEPKITMSDKIQLLDKHSMKLSTKEFYDLEGARQDALDSIKSIPLISITFGFGFFIYFAYRRPIHFKLYKELIYSGLLGLSCSLPYVLYYRHKYLESVNHTFTSFTKNMTIVEVLKLQGDKNIMKNFYDSIYDPQESFPIPPLELNNIIDEPVSLNNIMKNSINFFTSKFE